MRIHGVGLRVIAMSVVVAAIPVFAGACASEPPESEAKSAGASTEGTNSSSNETNPSTRKSAGGPPKADGPSKQAASAKIIDTDFRPVKLVVAVGTTIEWKQVGDQPHSVTAADDSFDSSPECGPLESENCLGEGDRFAHTFEEAGKYTYYCRVHGLPDGTGMVGTLVVR